MEVVDAVVYEEDGSSVKKTVRLLVTTDDGGSTKFRKIETMKNDQIPSIFLCGPRKNCATGSLVLQGPEEVSLPVANGGEKNVNLPLKTMDLSNTIKITTMTNSTQKKVASRTPAIKVIQTKSSSSSTSAQAAKPSANIVRIRSENSTQPTTVKLQNKAKAVSKVTVPAPLVQLKQQQTSHATTTLKTPVTSDLQAKTHCISFVDEQLPVLSEITEKLPQSTANVDPVTNGNCQTVTMRVNSLGEIELDPMFLSSEALNELEVTMNSSQKKEGLIVAEEGDSLEFQFSKPQGENANSSVNQNWFTSREDKDMLRWRGQSWRQGMWSREETELLQKNILEYCMDRNLSDPGSVIFKMSKEERNGFYRTIAKGLNRPLFSVYRRVIRMYDNRNHIGKYSAVEINKLRELRMKHGNNWQAIAARLGRSAASVKDRCRLLNENCNKGTWTVEEEDRLSMAVYTLAGVYPGEQVTTGIPWGEVAAKVKTRSEKQCRTKWLNYLNWKRTSGVVWSKSDDVQLICRLSVSGAEDELDIDWSVLSQGWPACRSPHWLRSKWWNLKKQLPRSLRNEGLVEMCQLLYNMQSMHVLQNTLIELPAINSSVSSTSPATPEATDAKSSSSSSSSKCDDSLNSKNIKFCIPASNFANIINSDNKNEDFASKLHSLVQTALVVPNNGDSPSSQEMKTLIAESNSSTPNYLYTQVSSNVSSATSDDKYQPIIVGSIEGSMVHIPEIVTSGVHLDVLLEQAGHRRSVKEEDLLSDAEVADTQSGLSTTLDPSSPATTSQVIINDPILSVSGEPLGREEGLQQDHDDDNYSSIVIV